MMCHEVAMDKAEGVHWLCIAERYTEHSHADVGPTMIPLPVGSTVALDDNDCLFKVELRGCQRCGSWCGVDGCGICEKGQLCTKCARGDA